MTEFFEELLQKHDEITDDHDESMLKQEEMKFRIKNILERISKLKKLLSQLYKTREKHLLSSVSKPNADLKDFDRVSANILIVKKELGNLTKRKRELNRKMPLSEEALKRKLNITIDNIVDKYGKNN